MPVERAQSAVVVGEAGLRKHLAWRDVEILPRILGEGRHIAMEPEGRQSCWKRQDRCVRVFQTRQMRHQRPVRQLQDRQLKIEVAEEAKQVFASVSSASCFPIAIPTRSNHRWKKSCSRSPCSDGCGASVAAHHRRKPGQKRRSKHQKAAHPPTHPRLRSLADRLCVQTGRTG